MEYEETIMKEYSVTFDFAENEEFEIPLHYQEFTVEVEDIDVAIRKVEKLLFRAGVIGYMNDYSTNYNFDETVCRVSFGDADKGLMLGYVIEEQ